MTDRREIVIRVMRLPHAQGLPLPSRQSGGAAGLDLQAAIDAHGPLTIASGSRVLIPTGFAIELPEGYEAQVRPRSGLALRHGVSVLNSPGTIDADYRGEVQVVIANLGGAPFEIRRGDRIAQLVVQPVPRIRLVEAADLSETARADGGFGSTGVSRAAKQAAAKKKKSAAKPSAKAKPGSARERTDKPPRSR